MQRRSREDGHRSAPRLLGLLALNGALLAVLGVVSLGPSAEAQPRVRGAYTMAGGDVNGSLSAVIYVVDTTNQELIAIHYDPSQKKLQGLGYRNLAADTAALRQGGLSR